MNSQLVGLGLEALYFLELSSISSAISHNPVIESTLGGKHLHPIPLG